MFIEISEGIIELKEDGSYIKHGCKFYNMKGKIFKEDLTTGDTVIVPPKILLTIDKTTKEIQCEQRGFIIDHELKPPIHPDAGKEYIQIQEKDIPADFYKDEGERIGKSISYIWDKGLKKKV